MFSKFENKNPEIDIIMHNHNKGQFLEETINSVFNQTYKNWNLFILDDYSQDDSKKILSKFNLSMIKAIRPTKLCLFLNSTSVFNLNTICSRISFLSLTIKESFSFKYKRTLFLLTKFSESQSPLL